MPYDPGKNRHSGSGIWYPGMTRLGEDAPLSRSCQFPMWADDAPKLDRRFCGRPTKPGSSYCADHHAVCHHTINRAAKSMASLPPELRKDGAYIEPEPPKRPRSSLQPKVKIAIEEGMTNADIASKFNVRPEYVRAVRSRINRGLI